MSLEDSSGSTLRQYVNDMLALEKGLLEAVERQRADERVKAMTDANTVILRIHSLLHEHVSVMENHGAALGSTPGGMLKDAVSSVTGAVAGLYDKLRQDPVSRMLRDDYTVLNLAAVSYGMLHTTGLALRDLVVANVALRHLQQLTPLIIELNRIIPSIVTKELGDEHDVDPEAASLANQHIEQAWKEGAEPINPAAAPLL